MNKTKILFLHSGAELYGADQILLTIVSNLDKKKFEPIVILPNDGPLVKVLKQNNVRTEIIQYPIVRRQYFNVKGIFSYLIEYVKANKKLSKFVSQEQISIVHNNTIAVLEGMYLKRKNKIKLITHVHEMIDHPYIISKILYKLIVISSDKIITVSQAVKNHINIMTKNKNENIEVIHNGIDFDKFSKELNIDYLYQEFKIPKDNSIILGMIGRVNAIKGQDDFIDIVAEIIKKQKNIYAIIVGDAFKGQEWRVEQMQKKIKELKLDKHIIYTGFRKDIPELHQFIDVYILPSIQNDSFPTVVLESMASGNPIIAYECGGVSEMIQNDVNGYLIQKREKKDAIDKLLYIVSDKKRYEKMGKKSQELAYNNFSIHEFIRNFERVYEEFGK